MNDPSDLLNLIDSGEGIFDEIGMNNISSQSSLPQTSSNNHLFNMDSFASFPNQTSGSTQSQLLHMAGQSQSSDQFQQFSQKLSHYAANPTLAQQGNGFPSQSVNKLAQSQSQQFPRMPGMQMPGTNQFPTQVSTSLGTNWRRSSNLHNSFGQFGLAQQSQPPTNEQAPTAGSPVSQGFMSLQQSNLARLQHFMTNKQSNPMLSQSPNQFMGQESSSNLTDISNSTPKLNQGKTVSSGRPFSQDQLNKLHHLVSGGMPSPTSDTSTNANSPAANFVQSSSSSFTSSPDPFLANKNMPSMFNNLQQRQQSPMSGQVPMQAQNPFSQAPSVNSMQQDYAMRRPPQFQDGNFQVRSSMPVQPQMMNQNPNAISNMKSAQLLFQLQRLQQQISQVRELPSPARDQPLQQLQQQFSRLYHLYLVDQQRLKKQQQTVSQIRFNQDSLLKQHHQDKANRIVAEAIAKSALMNSGYNYQAEQQMKMIGQQFGSAMNRPMNYDMKQDKFAQQRVAEPIVLPPTIVNQLPKTVRSSSK